jgi:FkbM family methyltransferase
MIKDLIRRILIFLQIDLTKNLKYDRLTLKLFDKILHADSNCIDIGCFKGEILDEILKRSPKGTHIGFEPIPVFFEALKLKYKNKENINILNLALSDQKGTTKFNYVVNAPAYSGLKKRDYDGKEPKIEELSVNTDTLDNVVEGFNTALKIQLIKIDVEGAEYKVFNGAIKTINQHKPIIIFEFGLGASNYYKTTPNDIFGFFTEKCNYRIYQFEDFLNDQGHLTLEKFETIYADNKEYYFIASPGQ